MWLCDHDHNTMTVTYNITLKSLNYIQIQKIKTWNKEENKEEK